MRRAAAPTSNASLLEIVSRNRVERGPGPEVIVFFSSDNTRLLVYPRFLTKTFTVALPPGRGHQGHTSVPILTFASHLGGHFCEAPVHYYVLLALTFLVTCYGTSLIVRLMESRMRLSQKS
jgi:hypothetical protein